MGEVNWAMTAWLVEKGLLLWLGWWLRPRTDAALVSRAKRLKIRMTPARIEMFRKVQK